MGGGDNIYQNLLWLVHTSCGLSTVPIDCSEDATGALSISLACRFRSRRRRQARRNIARRSRKPFHVDCGTSAITLRYYITSRLTTFQLHCDLLDINVGCVRAHASLLSPSNLFIPIHLFDRATGSGRQGCRGSGGTRFKQLDGQGGRFGFRLGL